MYQLSMTNASGGMLVVAGTGFSAPIAAGKYTPAVNPTLQPADRVEDVVEMVMEGLPADISAQIESIERMLMDAGSEFNRQYLLYTPTAAGSAWRARYHGGWIEMGMGDGALRRDLGSQAIRLHLVRDDFWEEAEDTLLPLTNGNGSGITNGLTLFNHDDSGSGHDNYAGIGVNSVGGDLPAACRIELGNTLDGGKTLGDVYIFNNARTVYSPMLEGENGAGCSGSSVQTDSASSNGQFMRLPWSATTAVDLLTWTLSSSLLDLLASRVVRPLMRLANPVSYTDLWLRLQVRQGSTVLSAGMWTLAAVNRGLMELPALALPPGNLGKYAAYAPLNLVLEGQKETAGTYTLDVDHLFLAPLDGDRKLMGVYGLPYGWALVDDGIEGVMYAKDANGKRLGSHAGYGSPMKLLPGRTQRLYFLHRQGEGCDIAHRLSVKVWYRARRRSL